MSHCTPGKSQGGAAAAAGKVIVVEKPIDVISPGTCTVTHFLLYFTGENQGKVGKVRKDSQYRSIPGQQDQPLSLRPTKH